LEATSGDLGCNSGYDKQRDPNPDESYGEQQAVLRRDATVKAILDEAGDFGLRYVMPVDRRTAVANGSSSQP